MRGPFSLGLIAPGNPLTADKSIRACALLVSTLAADTARNILGLVGMNKTSHVGVVAELQTPTGQRPDRLLLQDQEATNAMRLSDYVVDGEGSGLVVAYWTN